MHYFVGRQDDDEEEQDGNSFRRFRLVLRNPFLDLLRDAPPPGSLSVFCRSFLSRFFVSGKRFGGATLLLAPPYLPSRGGRATAKEVVLLPPKKGGPVVFLFYSLSLWDFRTSRRVSPGSARGGRKKDSPSTLLQADGVSPPDRVAVRAAHVGSADRTEAARRWAD